VVSSWRFQFIVESGIKHHNPNPNPITGNKEQSDKASIAKQITTYFFIFFLLLNLNTAFLSTCQS
jgi:hypothetical protein